jgi:hypothetical protein
MRKDGKFVGVDGTIPEGQGIVMAHLNECHELLEMVRYPCSDIFQLAKYIYSLQLKESMDESEEDDYDDEDEDATEVADDDD